jgi:glycosyltransferase involved in cell wall biosynthesis
VIEVSVVMPCLNEEETLGTCIEKARTTLDRLGVEGEIIVADNGSTDRSVEIATSLGARVVHQPRRGYGNAYLAGFDAARGKYAVMGDSDDSYDWTDIGRFLEPLRAGYDFVIGSRLKGRIEPGAMPFLHRYLGTPVLTAILNLLFGSRFSDINCGMRAFSMDAYRRMHLRASGMEFASEMVIQSARARLRVAEIPITLRPDRRTRPPHLHTWRDGWRHLRFMLLLSPTGVFLVPGAVLLLFGILLLAVLYPGPLHVAGRVIDVHTMILGSLCTILGVQVLSTGLFAKVYSYRHSFDRGDRLLQLLARHFNLERGLLLGMGLFVIGFALDLELLWVWIRSGFGPMNAVRQAVLGSSLLAVGAQVVFSSFFLSMLSVQIAGIGRDEEEGEV